MGRPEQAEGRAYGRRTAMEALAAAVGRALPGGRVRRGVRAAWHALLARGDGPVADLPGGERIRLLPAHRGLTWNLEEYRAFRAALTDGGVALDVGANVGAYALLFGRWVGTDGRVFAFEPAPAAFEGLSQHVALNGLVAIVEPIRAAVSDRAGTAAFLDEGSAGTGRLAPPPPDGTPEGSRPPPASSPLSHSWERGAGGVRAPSPGTEATSAEGVKGGPDREVKAGPAREVEAGPAREVKAIPTSEVKPGPASEVTTGPASEVTTVPTTTVDAFCAARGIAPTLLKVDAEGAELDVLRGARETIARGSGGIAVFVELHPSLWPERGIGADDLRRELARQGLRAEPLRPGVDPWSLEGECVRLVRE